jgi:hypothetical protein
MTTAVADAIPTREFLQEQPMAAWAGVSPRLLRQWADRGVIKRYRPAGGRLVFFRIEEVRQVIEGGLERTNPTAAAM